MKNVLIGLLTSAMIVALPCVNVFADTAEVSLTDDDSEGKVNLTATISSAYTIELPTSVNVAANSTTFTVRAKGDVDNAKEIKISEKNEGVDHVLADGADSENKVKVTVTPGDAIDGADVTDDYNSDAISIVTISHDTLKAGSYSCELPIVISLSTKQA